MIHPRADDDGCSGFTLLELLVALAIFALIAMALTGGVRFAGRAWESQQQRMDRFGDVYAADNVLRGMITSAHAIAGDSSSLRFTGALPAALERGGLYDIELHAEAGRLVLAWRPHFKGATQAADAASETLLTGITGLIFSYYVPSEGWKPSLDKTERPALVRIEMGSGNGSAWPPLIVATEIEPVKSDDPQHETVTDRR